MPSADSIQVVKDFLASLRSGGNGKPVPRAELLTEDAIFQTLGKIEGRDAVKLGKIRMLREAGK